MDASRLLAVLVDIDTEIGAFAPVLAKLTQAYTTARDTPAQDLSRTIREALEELQALLANSVTNLYTPSRRQLLEAIEGEGFVGNTAANHIDALLAQASMSPASAVTALQTYTTQLNQFRATCAQVQQGLTALHIKPDVLVGDEAEVGILLPRSLTQGHLDVLTRQLQRWNTILKGFAELAETDQREITVRMLSTGSDQIFLLTTLGVAALLSPVIDKVLDWYKKILEIRKLRLELERLGVPVAELQEAKAHEKKIIDDGITQLARELMERAPTTIPAGRKGELRNQLTISIQHIARFVDQGGDVEVTVAPPPQEEYVPPADAALTPVELEAKKVEWTAVQQQRPNVQERLDIARKGAALASLPNRERGILPLPEANSEHEVSEPAGEDAPKDDKRKKK
jgi:hypothetical protein